MGFKSFDALLARFDAGPAEIKAFLGEGPILTDDQPLTEYFLSLPQNDKPVDFTEAARQRLASRDPRRRVKHTALMLSAGRARHTRRTR